MRITLIGSADLCGRPWGPPRVNDGIPGTEEAFIHMADRLARLGHRVDVYVHAGEFAGNYAGAEWRDISTLPAAPDTDIIVTTDAAGIRPLETGALSYLWMASDGMDVSQPDFCHIHKFMALSQQSRHRFPAVPDSRFFLTRNGVDLTQFDQAIERNPFRAVYGSDYDRGLIWLLAAWPRIRAARPEAELDIFYGWDIFDHKIETYGRADPELGRQWAAFKVQLLKGMEHPGINHLGRVGHMEVARRFLSAGVFAYPCTFPETSCITAMKAQVAGAIPVVFGTAALRETVRWGLRTAAFDPGWPAEEKARVHNLWTDAVIGLLGDAETQEGLRQGMVPDSRNYFGWERVAVEWEAEFSSQLQARQAAAGKLLVS